ncbi:DNA adenine methylase [Methanolobus sediminis]|uniref:DNA adenine methylase n=1 Tax=Methanolobus sediminis TaxID=3072978 RepID=A0AA51YIM4_9EURY|nr:DNA adenine methylase [Methanolobus sediminis]WMW24685.1 DNA adenine methylase [Methanolobus sediminis]
MQNTKTLIDDKNKEQKGGSDFNSIPKDGHFVNNDFPSFIKYMGSKTKILDFVVDGINEIYNGGGICDLFSGSCSIAGSLGHSVKIYSNDIQAYSESIAHAYLTSWKKEESFISGQEIITKAEKIVQKNLSHLPEGLSYDDIKGGLKEFNLVEEANQSLIDVSFDFDWHLFTKYYSGTWWSSYQCLWIDAIREIAETQKSEPHYHLIISSLMHAMAYCSQGTGHYAQYRDAKTESSMKDISNYRQKKIADFFLRKYDSVSSELLTIPPEFDHEITTMDFRERLATLPKCTVYADPPYCFVHYSRFYHALETLVLYDYPDLQFKGGSVVKGRYRDDRHQSPFCIRTKVLDAFKDLFTGITLSSSNLVLSYSNTGMISLECILKTAESIMSGYHIEIRELNHKHMTMGRKNDRDRDVKEYTLLAWKE